MASQDPIPSPQRSARRQFCRIFGLLVGLALVIAAIAVISVSRGDSALHIHMMIATALGVFMTVLIGTGLMTLAFISNSSGHDEAAGKFHKENADE